MNQGRTQRSVTNRYMGARSHAAKDKEKNETRINARRYGGVADGSEKRKQLKLFCRRSATEAETAAGSLTKVGDETTMYVSISRRS